MPTLLVFLAAPSLAQAQAAAQTPASTPPCQEQGSTKIQPIAPTHTLPPYPGLSQRLGEQGITYLKILIGTDGSARSITVPVASGYPRLDDIAASYVQANWRWQPPARACLANVEVNWNLHAGIAEPMEIKPPLMSLPWEAGLNTSGAATYDVEFRLPPGTAGMAPWLSLHYDSSDAEYVMGRGWTLEHLPSVTHCQSAPQAFCMDRKHLVAIKGAYGADGTDYRDHFQDFTRTISHGGTGGEPEWFESQTKQGQTLEFGRTPDSREIDPASGKVRAWRVNSVSDAVGTYLTTRWEADPTTGLLHPLRIDYSGNKKTQLAPYNSVRFVYGAGTPLRLGHIQTFAGDRLISDYRLDYQQGDLAGLSHLKSLARCNSGGQCLAPLTFHWRDFETAFGKVPMATELEDGIGRHSYFTYTSAPKLAGTARPNYPDYFVTRVDTADSNGKRSGIAYSYEGDPIFEDDGTFYGFTTEARTEDATGVKFTTSYSAQPELIGNQTGETTTLNDVVLKTTKSDWSFRTDQPGILFPFISKETERDYDLDGTPMTGSEITHAYDEFGSETRKETHWIDGSSKVEENTYWSDVPHWYLDRLLSLHVTRSPAAPALDRESSFQYDHETGLLTQEVIEPHLRPYRIQTDYVYDAYGHRIEKKISGADVPTQLSKTEYDRRGLFVTSNIDASGSQEILTTDAATGQVETRIAANRSERHSYDGFGRALQYSDSQGNVANFRYAYCVGAGGSEPCPQYGAYFVDQTSSDPDLHQFVFFNAHGLVIGADNLIQGKRKTVETRKYDDRDNMIQFCRDQGGDALVCQDRRYDLSRRMTQQKLADASVSWTYHGLTSVRTDSFGNTLTIVKDAQDRIVSQASKDVHGERTAKFTYNGWGNKLQVIDADGGITSTTFNVRGFPIRATSKDGSEFSMHYNAFGQRTDPQ